jgi:tetratricopeptide (TPR) repeat protein
MMPTVRMARAVTLLAALATAAAAVPPVLRAEDPWYELYQDALKSIQSRKWAEAEKRLKAAMAAGPRPGRQVRMYGVRSIDYLPEYQLGLVYFNQRSYSDALEQLTKVQASGLVKDGDAEAEPLKDMLQLCRIRLGQPLPSPSATPAATPAPTPTPAPEDRGDASMVAIARDFMRQNRLAEARRIVDSALDKYPQSPAVLSAALELAKLEDKARATPVPTVAPTPRPSPSSAPTPGLPTAPERRSAFTDLYSGHYEDAAGQFARLAQATPLPGRQRLLAYQAVSLAAAALQQGQAGEAALAEARRLFAQSGAVGARVLAADKYISPAVRRALHP